MLEIEKKVGMHPTIRKCLQHLNVLEADDKTKQIVYMYMESLYKDLTDANILAFENKQQENNQLSN